MLDMFADAIVYDSQSNTIEYGYRDLALPLVTAGLSNGPLVQ